jgi:hypothetical protein
VPALGYVSLADHYQPRSRALEGRENIQVVAGTATNCKAPVDPQRGFCYFMDAGTQHGWTCNRRLT